MLIGLRFPSPKTRRRAWLAGAMLLVASIAITTPGLAQTETPTDIAPVARSRHRGGRYHDHTVPPALVMHGSETTALIAKLPWWRTAGPQPASAAADGNQGLAPAAELRPGFPPLRDSVAPDRDAGQREVEVARDRIAVADPDEINAIDLAAPAPPASSGWIEILFALALTAVGTAAFASLWKNLVRDGRRLPVPALTLTRIWTRSANIIISSVGRTPR